MSDEGVDHDIDVAEVSTVGDRLAGVLIRRVVGVRAGGDRRCEDQDRSTGGCPRDHQ